MNTKDLNTKEIIEILELSLATIDAIDNIRFIQVGPQILVEKPVYLDYLRTEIQKLKSTSK